MELGVIEAIVILGSILIAVRFSIRKALDIHWGHVSKTDEENVQGKTIVITGAGSGLGFETAVQMAQRGATIIITGRTRELAYHTVANIRNKTFLGKLIPMELELASLESIKRFGQELNNSLDKIDILINNAGVLMPVTKREKTKDGFEIHFGVNHLSHFLLTKLLLPLLKKSDSSRIVILTSVVHRGVEINFLDLMFEKSETLNTTINENPLYKSSKFANILFANELTKRLKYQGINIKVYSLCPGIVSSSIAKNLDLPWYAYYIFPIANIVFKTPQQGCQTILYCALSKKCQNETGQLYRNCALWNTIKFAIPDDLFNKPVPTIYSTTAAERLWEESEKLCGIKFTI